MYFPMRTMGFDAFRGVLLLYLQFMHGIGSGPGRSAGMDFGSGDEGRPGPPRRVRVNRQTGVHVGVFLGCGTACSSMEVHAGGSLVPDPGVWSQLQNGGNAQGANDSSGLSDSLGVGKQIGLWCAHARSRPLRFTRPQKIPCFADSR